MAKAFHTRAVHLADGRGRRSIGKVFDEGFQPFMRQYGLSAHRLFPGRLGNLGQKLLNGATPADYGYCPAGQRGLRANLLRNQVALPPQAFAIAHIERLRPATTAGSASCSIEDRLNGLRRLTVDRHFAAAQSAVPGTSLRRVGEGHWPSVPPVGRAHSYRWATHAPFPGSPPTASVVTQAAVIAHLNRC